MITIMCVFLLLLEENGVIRVSSHSHANQRFIRIYIPVPVSITTDACVLVGWFARSGVHGGDEVGAKGLCPLEYCSLLPHVVQQTSSMTENAYY